MKKKIKYLLLLLPFLIIPNVKATNLPNWASDIDYVQRASIFKCSSKSSCSEVSSSTGLIKDDGYYIIYNTTGQTLNDYGLGVNHYVGILDPNILYSYSLYLCSNKSIGSSSKSITTTSNSSYGWLGTKPNYQWANYYGLSATALKDLSTNESYTCDYSYSFNAIFSPGSTNTSINYFLSSSTSISNVELYVIGYKLEALGNYNNLTASDISQAIENSNIASASSVEEVQTSLEEVKTELQGAKEEQSKTNDILSDGNVDDSIEEGKSFFSNVADTTPTGSLGQFLTIPLTFVQSLLDTSCKKIELPLPFVSKKIYLPCLDTFWERMGALKTLINVVWLAVVGTRILSGIFKLTIEVVDTNPNKSDPICLKTWEL